MTEYNNRLQTSMRNVTSQEGDAMGSQGDVSEFYQPEQSGLLRSATLPVTGKERKTFKSSAPLPYGPKKGGSRRRNKKRTSRRFRKTKKSKKARRSRKSKK